MRMHTGFTWLAAIGLAGVLAARAGEKLIASFEDKNPFGGDMKAVVAEHAGQSKGRCF